LPAMVVIGLGAGLAWSGWRQGRSTGARDYTGTVQAAVAALTAELSIGKEARTRLELQIADLQRGLGACEERAKQFQDQLHVFKNAADPDFLRTLAAWGVQENAKALKAELDVFEGRLLTQVSLRDEHRKEKS